MHPILIDSWHGISIHSYGTLILLGTLLSMPGVWWDVRGRRIAADRRGLFFLDFYLVLFLGTVVGGRLMYALTTPDWLETPGLVFSLTSAGFVFFGSLLGIITGLALLSYRYRCPFGELMDVMTTWLPFTHAFGRIGCFMAGCCYGGPWTGPWSLRFPSKSVAYRDASIPHQGDTTVGLFPTQSIEAAGLLAIGVWLWSIRLRRGPQRPWSQTVRYALAYGSLRFVVELFRGDADRRFLVEWKWPAAARQLGLADHHLFGVSTSQAGALVLIALALVALWRWRRGVPSSDS